MKRSFADILAGLDDNRARKLARKLPEWAAAGAEIPSALSLEQCSSSATARYKASVTQAATASGNTATLGTLRGGTASEAQRWGPKDVSGGSWPLRGQYLDLTCGLGVDSWAFSQVAERVVSYERDAALCEAARRNFARLGADNIEVRCETVSPATELPEADLIYADPARRDAAGRKVFLLEDCTPDVLTLLPMLFRKAPVILLKLSPMADLTMLAQRLGPALREIHVVESDGEVKELLCLLLRDEAQENPEIVVARLSGGAGAPWGQEKRPRSASEMPSGGILPAGRSTTFRFSPIDERNAEAQYVLTITPGETLLEPCPALLKAGAFNLPCARWGLQKLATSTHLYTGSLSEEAAPWFKARQIREVLPLGAAAFRQIRQRWPRAEVTARNLPLGSAELQKKMGVSPGGDTHIFGCRLADGGAVLIVTE